VRTAAQAAPLGHPRSGERGYTGIYERVIRVEKKRFPNWNGKLITLLTSNRRTTTVFYLGIDQHARQLTISLRDEEGDVVLSRQVSTQPEKVNAFFEQLTRERLQEGESFLAVVEVCGFNDWLIQMLRDYRCGKVILIQPEERKRRKTDRRDAAALSELLWVNRTRFLQGKPIRGLRQVDIASTSDQETRRLTMLRQHAGRERTRIVNRLKHLLRRHNLQWEIPTKKFPTQLAIAWLKTIKFSEIDQLEVDYLVADLESVQQRIKELEQVITDRCEADQSAMILTSTPGVAQFTAVSLACRIGRVERFPRSHSLANYWGLTPGCRNSGENNQRLGHITKAGSGMARWLLAQVTVKVLREDKKLREWFKRIRRRRGSGVARVAVMRKLATIFWHMLTKNKTYAECREFATG
jgi:transposase